MDVLKVSTSSFFSLAFAQCWSLFQWSARFILYSLPHQVLVPTSALLAYLWPAEKQANPSYAKTSFAILSGEFQGPVKQDISLRHEPQLVVFVTMGLSRPAFPDLPFLCAPQTHRLANAFPTGCFPRKDSSSLQKQLLALPTFLEFSDITKSQISWASWPNGFVYSFLQGFKTDRFIYQLRDLLIYLFERECDRWVWGKEKERESLHLSFISQIVSAVMSGPGLNWESETPPWSLHGRPESKHLGHYMLPRYVSKKQFPKPYSQDSKWQLQDADMP